MGKRKMPPKLPQQTKNGMRMLFARAVGYEPEDLTAAMATANALAACPTWQLAQSLSPTRGLLTRCS